LAGVDGVVLYIKSLSLAFFSTYPEVFCRKVGTIQGHFTVCRERSLLSTSGWSDIQGTYRQFPIIMRSLEAEST
jgi:hypothetical protein